MENEREKSGVLLEILIRRENLQATPESNGAYQEISVRALNAVAAAGVEMLRRLLEIIGLKRQVQESTEVYFDPLELHLVTNPGKEFLTHRSDEFGSTLPYEFHERIGLSRRRGCSAKCFRPDRRIHDDVQRRFLCAL
jgi:hypothetical protein